MSGMPAFDGGSSGSVVLGVTAAVNVTSSGTSVYLRPRGGSAVVNVNVTTTGALAAGDTLFTLPNGSWPPSGIGTAFGTLVRISDNANIRVHINAAGIVTTQNTVASGVTLRGQIVIPL